MVCRAEVILRHSVIEFFESLLRELKDSAMNPHELPRVVYHGMDVGSDPVFMINV